MARLKRSKSKVVIWLRRPAADLVSTYDASTLCLFALVRARLLRFFAPAHRRGDRRGLRAHASSTMRTERAALPRCLLSPARPVAHPRGTPQPD